jgi:hypothetical protein
LNGLVFQDTAFTEQLAFQGRTRSQGAARAAPSAEVNSAEPPPTRLALRASLGFEWARTELNGLVSHDTAFTAQLAFRGRTPGPWFVAHDREMGS